LPVVSNVSPQKRAAQQANVHESWAHTDDRTERTAPARAAFEARFLEQAGGDLVKAEHLRKAYFLRLQAKSLRARRRAAELRALIEAEEAEAELEALGGGESAGGELERLGPIHGSYSTYTNHGCRCQDCRDAQARYRREARRRKAAELRALGGGELG
jgi:hypothetical protein